MKLLDIPSDVNERIDYDPETGSFKWIGGNRYQKRFIGREAGSKSNGYLRIRVNSGIKYLAHRIAWYLVTGNQPTIIDHINGDGMDNRFCNLRECTNAENSKNHGRVMSRLMQPCGVTLLSSGNYRARVTCDGKTIGLGTYKTSGQAEAAYKEKRAELFKEFNRD